jgi:hypothetical protein
MLEGESYPRIGGPLQINQFGAHSLRPDYGTHSRRVHYWEDDRSSLD